MLHIIVYVVICFIILVFPFFAIISLPDFIFPEARDTFGSKKGIYKYRIRGEFKKPKYFNKYSILWGHKIPQSGGGEGIPPFQEGKENSTM
jgi:hypothetical protein